MSTYTSRRDLKDRENGAQNKECRRKEDAWTLDKRISAGNVLTLIVVLVGAVLAWGAMDTRITLNAKDVTTIQSTLADQKGDILDRLTQNASDQQRQIDEVKSGLLRIEKKLDAQLRPSN